MVGRVPYRGFFDLEDALDEQRKLEEEGFDTWLRPTSAFSTLGWFADPLMSTVLRQDEIGVVQTILHEVSHAHLWVSGSVSFNESFATFVGDAGAAAFFCAESGEIATVRCTRARRRWGDAMKFSVFLDRLVADLERVYDDAARSREERLSAREQVFAEALEHFTAEVQPSFEASTYAGFVDTPLNNATLLARMRYYHRLPDFQALLDDHGGDVGGRRGLDCVTDAGTSPTPLTCCPALPRPMMDPCSQTLDGGKHHATNRNETRDGSVAHHACPGMRLRGQR